MKVFVSIIIACMLSIILNSCQKPAAKTLSSKNRIIGKWELVQAQNGMTPTISYPNNNGHLLVFSDSTFEQYEGNQVIKKGNYVILVDTTVIKEVGLEIEKGKFTNRIVYNNEYAAPKTFVHISESELTFLSGFFPLDSGSKMVYKRIDDK
ncbi:MAG: hypothetical protein V4717_10435 [Bacteroidota bacterium]